MIGSGDCDYVTGICACNDGMISSDGFNHVGVRGDCGYIRPMEDALASDLLIPA